MLHEEMLSMSAASCPSVQRPNDSPRSQLRSMEGMGIRAHLGARRSAFGTRCSGSLRSRLLSGDSLLSERTEMLTSRCCLEAAPAKIRVLTPEF
jgi:hypothetical protein